MGMKRTNVFEKIESSKEILKPVIEGKTDREIKRFLCHCVYYQMGRKKDITGEEREIYDFILKSNLKPKTLYKYFLILDYPEHVRNQLRECKMSLDEARSKSFAYKRMINTKNGKEIMAEMLAVIRRLEWKGLNSTMQRV